VKLHPTGPKRQAGGASPEMRTCGARAACLGLGTSGARAWLPPSAAQAPRGTWDACLKAEHTTAHTWHLGCAGSEPCSCPTWGHLMLGS
jgi:hypothetical protein